jgi:subtilisin family serine protease
MKKLLVKFLAIFLMVGFFNACEKSLVDEQTSDELALKSAQIGMQSYIVLLEDADLNSALSDLRGYEMKRQAVHSASSRILKRAGISEGIVEHVYGTAIKGFSVKLPPGQLKKLQDDPSVVLVEKDQFVQLIEPTKVTVKARPKPTPPAQTVPWGIGRVNGGVSGATGTAWVIDTGIDLDHPELNVDTSRSKTFVSSKSADDDNGHGSHVAGIIAARDNSIGVIGVAAGAKLVAVKVLTRSGSGTTSGVIAGVDYVAANAKSGDVANMSLGGVVSVLLDQAVLNASSNCVFALAAGNEGDDANNHSPARVDGDNIYTISAMDSADKFASWSNWGNPPVDYCEPGVSIYSCYKGGGYATMSGTSMAAPHAAGLLLLGSIKSDSKVTGDPDGNADPIGEH